MEPVRTYERFTRDEWMRLGQQHSLDHLAPELTPSRLAEIKAFNDQISLEDVTRIYGPLIDYIELRYTAYRRAEQEQADFLYQPADEAPFVIGVAGSVAVGKTTTARLLQYLLQERFGADEVVQITTDGFIKPNAQLKAEGIMSRKGFPESYRMNDLLTFMRQVKDGQDMQAPKYSHDVSDVLTGEYESFRKPKFFIIEGINTLQMMPGSPVYLADYFDFSIYIDAETALIEQWYLDRFQALLAKARVEAEPKPFFRDWIDLSLEEALTKARQVWRQVNLVNLEQYILPTRDRADLILHKTNGHLIDEIWLRK